MALVVQIAFDNAEAANVSLVDNSAKHSGSPTAREKAFSAYLRDSVQDGLAYSLGPKVYEALLIEGIVHVESDPEELHKQLDSAFGHGARVLEKLIAKALYSKLNIPYSTPEDFDFQQVVAAAKGLHVRGRGQL